MISILVPSRGRPDNIRRLYKSLEDTTKGKWELLVRLDSDDPALKEYPDGWELSHLFNLVGPRALLSELWNQLLPLATGEVIMHGGDDITFLTPGWDQMVKAAFPEDGIAFVHGDDLSPNAAKLGTHGFLRREWIMAVGYFLPPYFASDYNDLWLNTVADMIGRRVYLPEVKTEHHHPAFGKAEWDITHQERLARHRAENVDWIWESKADERLADAEKLRAVMKADT